MSFANMAPVFIMAFNRPHYLKRVIDSLKNQVGATLTDQQVYFMLDGAVNPFSNERYADDQILQENIAIFQKAFPNGNVRASDKNLGVALNFERAEAFAFEEMKADIAFFFEDDLELGPAYLATLERLRVLAESDPRIGYVGAYGAVIAADVDQSTMMSQVIPLEHHWAFGLTRNQWLRSKPYVDQYLQIVRGKDYRKRSTADLAKMYDSWGVGIPGTSQDVAKAIACYLTGGLRINTAASFGKYIGEIGLHTTAKTYERMGYASASTYGEDRFTKVELTPDDVKKVRARMQEYAHSRMAGAPVSSRNQPQQSGASFSQEEVVTGLFKGLLGRDPDESGRKAWLGRFLRGETLPVVFEALTRSTEFKRRHGVN